MAGSLQTVTDGKNLQNFLICLEMLPAALGMMFAFPYTEYKGQGARAYLLPACDAIHRRHLLHASLHKVLTFTLHSNWCLCALLLSPPLPSLPRPALYNRRWWCKLAAL